jgi:hypothetical protein
VNCSNKLRWALSVVHFTVVNRSDYLQPNCYRVMCKQEVVAVSGTHESIGRKLRERYAGLLDRIALYQPYEALVDESRGAALVRQFKA